MVNAKTKGRLIVLATLVSSVFLPNKVFSQTFSDLPDSIRIDRVIVAGNVHTKTPIITRELEFQPGDMVSRGDLQLARKRIENLYLFNRVRFLLLKDNEETILKIIVTERWYIFPIPILSFSEHSFSKVSYGGGVANYNFRGRAEKLFFLGWAGFNPGLKFSYRNDWFGGKKRYFASVSLHSIRRKNHTEAFSDLTSLSKGLSVHLGRRFGIYRFVGLQAQIDQIIPSNSLAAANASGKDLWEQMDFFIKYDNRDLHEYPTSGQLTKIQIGYAWLNGSSHQTQSFACDFRLYRSIKSLIFAGRASGSFLHGTIPAYKHVFLGFGERIRGHFTEVYEGENRLIASAALRFPIIPKYYYSLSKNISSLRDLEFAVYGTFFGDTGTVFNQKSECRLKSLQSGFGMGFNIVLPYSNIMRFEYAWNENLQGQFIFDGEVAF